MGIINNLKDKVKKNGRRRLSLPSADQTMKDWLQQQMEADPSQENVSALIKFLDARCSALTGIGRDRDPEIREQVLDAYNFLMEEGEADEAIGYAVMDSAGSSFMELAEKIASSEDEDMIRKMKELATKMPPGLRAQIDDLAAHLAGLGTERFVVSNAGDADQEEVLCFPDDIPSSELDAVLEACWYLIMLTAVSGTGGICVLEVERSSGILGKRSGICYGYLVRDGGLIAMPEGAASMWAETSQCTEWADADPILPVEPPYIP